MITAHDFGSHDDSHIIRVYCGCVIGNWNVQCTLARLHGGLLRIDQLVPMCCVLISVNRLMIQGRLEGGGYSWSLF